MKKFIISMCCSIITLFLLSLVSSIIIATLKFNKSINTNYYLIQFISIVIFLISGMIFGLTNKKQGLLGSITFILVYLIFVLIFDVFNKSADLHKLYFLFVISKCLSYSAGSIIGVNIRH